MTVGIGVRSGGEEEEIARERAQQHALDPFEIEEAVVSRDAHSLEEWSAGVVRHHPHQPAHIAHTSSLGVTLEAGDIVAELGDQAHELGLFVGHVAPGVAALAAGRAVRGVDYADVLTVNEALWLATRRGPSKTSILSLVSRTSTRRPISRQGAV